MCGQAANFTNLSALLTFPNKARFEANQSYTISFWIKSSQTVRADLFDQRTGSFDPNLANVIMIINQPSVDGQFGLPHYVNYPPTSNSTLNMASLNITDGSWHHFALVKDLSLSTPEIRVYEDACLVYSTTIVNSPFTQNGTFRMGNNHAGNGPFDGLIDEFKVYKRVLTDTEIFNSYRSCKPMSIVQTKELCSGGEIQACIYNPQANVSYSIIDELRTKLCHSGSFLCTRFYMSQL